MQIICQSSEEARYRLDILGDVVEFINWHKNTLTIAHELFALPQRFQPDFHQRIDEQIQKLRKFGDVSLTGGE